MSTPYLIAAGHDNTAGLAALYTLVAPHFKRYRLDQLAEWHSQEALLRDGARQQHPVGRPYVVWIFQVLTPAELDLLRTAFFPATALDADVTIQTLNHDLQAALRYNGVARWPTEVVRDRGAYRDVRLTIDQLVQITGFSRGFDPLAFGG